MHTLCTGKLPGQNTARESFLVTLEAITLGVVFFSSMESEDVLPFICAAGKFSIKSPSHGQALPPANKTSNWVQCGYELDDQASTSSTSCAMGRRGSTFHEATTCCRSRGIACNLLTPKTAHVQLLSLWGWGYELEYFPCYRLQMTSRHSLWALETCLPSFFLSHSPPLSRRLSISIWTIHPSTMFSGQH